MTCELDLELQAIPIRREYLNAESQLGRVFTQKVRCENMPDEHTLFSILAKTRPHSTLNKWPLARNRSKMTWSACKS